MTSREILAAIEKALAGEWAEAHRIVQADEQDRTACWVHAVLHKIEGDAANSRYWYARAGRRYEDHANAETELKVIAASITA